MQPEDQVQDIIVIEDGKIVSVTRKTVDGGQIQLSEDRGYTVEYRNSGGVPTADTKTDVERRTLTEEKEMTPQESSRSYRTK